MFTQIFSVGSQVEAVIHFDDDTEELQQWDQQVSTTISGSCNGNWNGNACRHICNILRFDTHANFYILTENNRPDR
jgi:hypothetical protein